MAEAKRPHREATLQRYLNLGGDSGVAMFEIGAGSITVQFVDGWCYLYTNQSAGGSNITEMQSLARSGQGLNSFINRAVRKSYAKKWR